MGSVGGESGELAVGAAEGVDVQGGELGVGEVGLGAEGCATPSVAAFERLEEA